MTLHMCCSVVIIAGEVRYTITINHFSLIYICVFYIHFSSSLPVDCMQKQHQTSAWLRRQRPVMNCCPNCKKPLPKCYICLSFMGLMNPQVEVKMTLARRNHRTAQVTQAALECTHGAAGGDNTGDKNAVSSTIKAQRDEHDLQHHNVFDYGKWFIWCQNCKHGGHASCIDSWFNLHDVCGVNGCECKCRKDQHQTKDALS